MWLDRPENDHQTVAGRADREPSALLQSSFIHFWTVNIHAFAFAFEITPQMLC